MSWAIQLTCKWQLQGGVLASGEAVCCVPSTLVALCLNNSGLKRVEESRALECLVPIFTTPNYLRALQVEPQLSRLSAHCSKLSTETPL